jgi:hypothetical protein
VVVELLNFKYGRYGVVAVKRACSGAASPPPPSSSSRNAVTVALCLLVNYSI